MMASPTGRGLPDEGSRCIRKPGTGVHFDHDSALVLQRTGDVQGNDVDAGHVQADHLGSFDRPGGDFGMDQIGHVGRGAAGAQIAVAADDHLLPGRRDRVGRIALLAQDVEADRVEFDFLECGGMIVAAARVAIDLVDQLANRRTGRRPSLAPARDERPRRPDRPPPASGNRRRERIVRPAPSGFPRGRR